MIEQAETEPRPLTVRRIEEFWGDMNLEFDDPSDGGLRLTVHAFNGACVGAAASTEAERSSREAHREKIGLVIVVRASAQESRSKDSPRAHAI